MIGDWCLELVWSLEVGIWSFSLSLFDGSFQGRRRLRRWRIEAVLEEGRDFVLDLIELVELQIGIDDGEDIAARRLFVNEHAMTFAHDLFLDLEQALSLGETSVICRAPSESEVTPADGNGRSGAGGSVPNVTV